MSQPSEIEFELGRTLRENQQLKTELARLREGAPSSRASGGKVPATTMCGSVIPPASGLSAGDDADGLSKQMARMNPVDRAIFFRENRARIKAAKFRADELAKGGGN